MSKSAWNDVVDEERIGMTSEMLQRLLAVNPNMRGAGSPDDMLRLARTPQAKVAPAIVEIAAPSTVATRLTRMQKQLAQKLESIDAEIRRLQALRTHEQAKVKQEVVALAQSEPEAFASAELRNLLERLRPWLNALGLRLA